MSEQQVITDEDFEQRVKESIDHYSLILKSLRELSDSLSRNDGDIRNFELTISAFETNRKLSRLMLKQQIPAYIVGRELPDEEVEDISTF